MHHNRSRRRVFYSLFDSVRGHADFDWFQRFDFLTIGVVEADVHGVEASGLAFNSAFDGGGDGVHIFHSAELHGGAEREGFLFCDDRNGNSGLCRSFLGCVFVVSTESPGLDGNRIFEGNCGVGLRIYFHF